MKSPEFISRHFKCRVNNSGKFPCSLTIAGPPRPALNPHAILVEATRLVDACSELNPYFLKVVVR